MAIDNKLQTLQSGVLDIRTALKECDQSLAGGAINTLANDIRNYYDRNNVIVLYKEPSTTTDSETGEEVTTYTYKITKFEWNGTAAPVFYNTNQVNGKIVACIFPSNINNMVQNNTFKDETDLEYVNLDSFSQIYGSGSFENCTSLKTITFPPGFTYLQGSSFKGCSSLVSIYGFENISTIGNHCFQGCSKLSEIHVYSLEGFLNNNIRDWTQLPFAYSNAKLRVLYVNGQLITNLEIPSTFTSVGNYLFYKNNTIESVVFPNTVTSVGNQTFQECTGLTSITFSNVMTSIGNSAFYKCTNLNGELIVPASATSIGNNAFAYCTSLKNIFLLGVTTIEAYKRIFDQCSNIVKISLPVIQTIKNNSLFLVGSTKLSEIDLGPNVITIGTNFISGNNTRQLDRFICRAQTPPTFNKLYKNPKAVYVPYSADHSILDTYKNATNWSSYATFMHELNEDGSIPE